MGKIQDLAVLDKPREKALRFGIEKLSDAELLALIINVGTVGHSSLDIAKELLMDSRSLSAFFSKPHQYFKTFKGLKGAKSLKLAAVSEIAKRILEKQHLAYEEVGEVTSESLFQRYYLPLMAQTQENLIIIILNKNKQIIHETTLYKGDDGSMVISSRDILRLIMLHNGYYFYLIHNHPNNTLTPSESDILFTKRIKSKAKRIGVTLLDHLIICKDGYYSFLHEQLSGDGVWLNN